jgi:hypothetical protein
VIWSVARLTTDRLRAVFLFLDIFHPPLAASAIARDRISGHVAGDRASAAGEPRPSWSRTVSIFCKTNPIYRSAFVRKVLQPKVCASTYVEENGGGSGVTRATTKSVEIAASPRGSFLAWGRAPTSGKNSA